MEALAMAVIRRWALISVAVAPILLAGVSVKAQQAYKSVLPDGRIVYSDRPPPDARLDKTIKLERPPSTALPASSLSYVERLRKAMAAAPIASDKATGNAGVVLYAAAWCGYCRQARAYLAAKGVAYREFDIDTPQGLAAYAQAGGGRGVPLLTAGEGRVQGYSVAAYDGLFGNPGRR
jgi:glutaredoxin